MHPIPLFTDWFHQECSLANLRIPSACCLSTNGTDGFPNARFVSLKEVRDDCFVVTGPLNARKGLEISRSDKVALTFWWTATERQVRVQGIATKISDDLADRYFQERSRDSQLVSLVSRQGEALENPDLLFEQYNQLDLSTTGEDLKRPRDWGGYAIAPIRIEFLAFQPTRFHNRVLFERSNGQWTEQPIQP